MRGVQIYPESLSGMGKGGGGGGGSTIPTSSGGFILYMCVCASLSPMRVNISGWIAGGRKFAHKIM